jgi:hypothetical protein
MLDELKNTLKKIKNEKIKNGKFKFGEAWEEEVREDFFISDYYDVLEKTHNYQQNKKDFVKSSLNPDYKFLCKSTKKEFYIECKARDITNLIKKTEEFLDEYEILSKKDEKKSIEFEDANKYLQLFDLCSEEQFYRFKKLNNTTKVLFMVLLISDQKYRDDIISLIPIDDLLTHKIFYSQILAYQIVDSEIEPAKLWRNFLLFYGLPAFCIRCNKKVKLNNLNPFCYECWEKWFNEKKFIHQEKYCHACGKEYKTASVKPLCIDCYKKFPINYPL